LKRCGDFGKVTAPANGSIYEACAIKMGGKTVCVSAFGHSTNVCFIPDNAPGVVVRVFDADHPAWWCMRDGRIENGKQLVSGEDTPRCLERS
jgi:hypothetical protein